MSRRINLRNIKLDCLVQLYYLNFINNVDVAHKVYKLGEIDYFMTGNLRLFITSYLKNTFKIRKWYF